MKGCKFSIKVEAENDGNPRRGWIVYDLEGGGSRLFVDEGYEGKEALHKVIPAGYYGEIDRLEISGKEYRRLKTMGSLYCGRKIVPSKRGGFLILRGVHDNFQEGKAETLLKAIRIIDAMEGN